MKIALLAGEASGDAYGALLARCLRRLVPEAEFLGLVGERMAAEGVRLIGGVPYGIIGFSGVVRNLAALRAGFRKVLDVMEAERPSAIVFIDNPGFNLRLAEELGGRRGQRCYYYIPPKVWAHDYSRVRVMRRSLAAVIAIFPFEPALFEAEGIRCRYFGHPVSDIIDFQPPKGPFFQTCGLLEDEPVVGFLPGSRRAEVQCLMPAFLEILRVVRARRKVQPVFSAAGPAVRGLITQHLRRAGATAPVWEGTAYPIMKYATAVLAASGTANLEIAAFRTPQLVLYRMTPINYALTRLVVKLRMISPVNIVLGSVAVPEFIQRFSSDEVAGRLGELLDRGPLYRREMEGYDRLSGMLAPGQSVTESAARFLADELRALCSKNTSS